jgi:hypothetical protein
MTQPVKVLGTGRLAGAGEGAVTQKAEKISANTQIADFFIAAPLIGHGMSARIK